MESEKTTCADRVHAAWEFRRTDLRLMLIGPEEDDVEIVDDGTLDTVVRIGDEEFRYASRHAAQWRMAVWECGACGHVVDDGSMLDAWDAEDDGCVECGARADNVIEPGRFDAVSYLDEEGDAIAERLHDCFCEYGLAFDYVAPGTFGGEQREGYWRYQMSWGGPSEEIRFYSSDGETLYKAEFWLLDWGDGAFVHVLGDDVAAAVWAWFVDVGAVECAKEEAE